MKSERQGRPIFYGAMITEGIVALVWAAISSYFFFDNGWEEVGGSLSSSAPQVVAIVSESWLGTFGGILALLGVVAAPITSGDTALRSARLIIAEFLHMAQKSIRSRLYICLPLFAVTMLILWFNIADEEGFNVVWNYFGWANQALSVFTLWTLTVYLVQQHKPFIVTLVPALFMTVVCSTFLIVSPTALGLSTTLGYSVAGCVLIVALGWFYRWYRTQNSYKKNF